MTAPRQMTSLRETIRSARPFRAFLLGFAGAGAVVAALSAHAASRVNSDAPVNFAADRIELQDKQNRVILTGNVDITQDDMRMRSARTVMAYTNTGGDTEIQRIDATGGVVVTQRDETARGDVAVYDVNRRLITMVGNVALRRGTDTLNGGRLVIDLDSGRSSVDGRSGGSAVPGVNGSGNGGGRISGTFKVPKRNDSKQ